MATMSNNEDIRRGAEGLVSCVICTDHFKTPKVLPCQHTFCLPCLKHYHNSCNQRRIMHMSNFPCPTCRKIAYVPQGGLECFPNDFKVVQFQDFLAKINVDIKDEKVSRCDVCTHDNKQNAAAEYCISCSKYLCTECATQHKKTQLFKGHSTLSVRPEDIEILVCPEHQEEVKYFCMKCSIPLCTVCVFSKHNEHEVCDLATALEQKREFIHMYVGSLNEKLFEWETKAEQLAELRRGHEETYRETRDSVRMCVARMEESIRQQETEMLTELDTTYNDSLREISKLEENISVTTGSIGTICDSAQDVLFPAHSLSLLASGKDLMERLSTTTTPMSQHIPDNVRKTMKFTPATEMSVGTMEKYWLPIREDLEEPASGSGNLQPAPLCSERGRASIVPRPPHAGHRSGSPDSQKSKRDEEKPTSDDSESDDSMACQSFAMSLQWDKRELANVKSTTFLSDGRLVAVQHVTGAAKLVVLDSFGNYNTMCMHDSSQLVKPWGVAANMHNSSVLLTDPGDSSIKVLDVNLAVTQVWRHMFSKPSGVAVLRTGEFVVTDIGNRYFKVSIHLPSGLRIREFASKGSDEGKLVCPNYVAIDHQDRILISDAESHCIKIFDRRGTQLLQFTSTNDSGAQMIPQGMCVDQENNIFVVDQAYGGISLYNCDGGFIKHITRTPALPWGISLHENKQLVITTEAGLFMYRIQ